MLCGVESVTLSVTGDGRRPRNGVYRLHLESSPGGREKTTSAVTMHARGKRYSCQMVSSPAKGKIVPGNEVDAVVAGIPPFSMHRCDSIAFGPPRERPRNLGTATVVNMFGGVFLVTAKHVVDSGPAKEFPWRLLVPARDSAGRIPDR